MNVPATLAHVRARLEYYLGAVVSRHLAPAAGAGAPAAWMPRAASGQPSGEQFALPGGLCVQSFMGFTATGIVTGLGANGLQTREFKQLPVEDLQLLDQWMADARNADLFPGPLAAA